MTIAPTADAISPLGLGKKVPDGSLQAMDGSQTTLYEALQEKPTILIFYRGEW